MADLSFIYAKIAKKQKRRKRRIFSHKKQDSVAGVSTMESFLLCDGVLCASFIAVKLK
jgi:hypothetical protein